MSGEVIRDVVIRVALETKANFTGGGNAGIKELDELNQRAKDARKSIEATHASMQQMMQNPLFRGVHHALVTGSPISGVHAGVNMAVNNQLAPLMHNQSAMAGLARFGPYAAVAVGSLALLSAALQSVVENLRKYDQTVTRQGEQAAGTMYGLASARLSGRMGIIGANQDISHFTTMARRERSRIGNEAAIEAAQAGIAHRPLAEREAMRARMEAQNELALQGQESAARMEHLNQQAEATKAARELAEVDLRNSQQSNAAAKAQREGHTNAQKPTWLGSRLIPGLLGASPLSAIAPDWGVAQGIAGAFGGVTPNLAAERAGESQVEGVHANTQAAEKEMTLENEIAQNKERQLELDRQRAQEAEKRLGTLRETVVVLRQQAQAMAEQQRGNERSFGALSPGMQARLRRIQAKANRGESLNWRERGLAIQHHIDAEDEANAENEAIANRPENARLFKRGRGRVNDVQQQLAAAQGQQQQEQQGLINQINQYSQNMKEGVDSLSKTATEIARLSEVIITLGAMVSQLATSLEQMKDKHRSWFGG